MPGVPSVLTPQDQDFPRWYQEVIAKAQLAENGPVRGTMVIRPWGYAIWERLQAAIDERIKAAGASNAYFPLLIPEGFLRREADHVEGFSPELAVVTHGGGKALEEPLVVRPTSETIINCVVCQVDLELSRSPAADQPVGQRGALGAAAEAVASDTEFLWQEGHTAHARARRRRMRRARILEASMRAR